MISSSQRPLPDKTQHSQQTIMPPMGFEPTISTGERPQTYALDRAATGTGDSALWWFNIAGNNNAYFGLHVKYQVFLPQFGFSRQIFIKSPQYQISWKFGVADTRGQTEGHGAISDYVNAPKNRICVAPFPSIIKIRKAFLWEGLETLIVVREMILSSYPASCNSFRTRAVDPGSGDLREEEACRSTWVCLFVRYRHQPKNQWIIEEQWR